MATPLTNTTVQSTYPALIKIGNNSGIDGSIKVLSDGLGTELPVQVSTSTFKVTGTLDTTTGIINVAAPTANSNATTKLYVDTQDGALNTLISGNASDITTLNNTVITIFGWTLNGLALSDNITLVGAGGVTVTDDGNNTITITGSAADVVDSLNSLTGDVTLSGGTNVTLDVVGNNIEINAAGGGGGGAVDSVNSLTGAIDIVSTDLGLLTVSTNGQDIELNPILPRTMLEDIINVSGGTIQKGQALHITGSNGNAAEVVLADSSLGLAAHLICFSNTIADGDPGKAVAVGFIGNVSVADTTNFQPGTHVYLSTGGGFTHIRPTGTNIVQFLGIVLNASTTSGAGTISGIIQNLGEENSLPNLQQNYVWEGNINGVPQAVHQNTLSVASAVTAQTATSATTAQSALYADDAADVKIDAVTSGTFRVILGDDGQASGAYQRLKSDVGNGFTYNPSGDVVSAGAFTSVNAITAGGALSGASLGISGNADIDGNLTLGGIGNVEGEINQNASDIAALQAIPQVAPVVNISTDITIDDDSYNNKFVVSSSGSEITLDNIQAWQPTVGTEIYFMSTSGPVSITGNPTILYPPGKTEFSRGTNSVIGIKCIDAGSLPTTEATWVIFGDLT